MSKCTMCIDRLEQGLKPICVLSCSMRALEFGPLEEITSRYGNLEKTRGHAARDDTASSRVQAFRSQGTGCFLGPQPRPRSLVKKGRARWRASARHLRVRLRGHRRAARDRGRNRLSAKSKKMLTNCVTTPRTMNESKSNRDLMEVIDMYGWRGSIGFVCPRSAIRCSSNITASCRKASLSPLLTLRYRTSSIQSLRQRLARSKRRRGLGIRRGPAFLVGGAPPITKMGLDADQEDHSADRGPDRETSYHGTHVRGGGSEIPFVQKNCHGQPICEGSTSS